jgi:hypothetical protein
MRRREFVTLLAGAAAWPLEARAQGERMRQIGVLMGWPESDDRAQSWIAACPPNVRYRGQPSPQPNVNGHNGTTRAFLKVRAISVVEGNPDIHRTALRDQYCPKMGRAALRLREPGSLRI